MFYDFIFYLFFFYKWFIKNELREEKKNIILTKYLRRNDTLWGWFIWIANVLNFLKHHSIFIFYYFEYFYIHSHFWKKRQMIKENNKVEYTFKFNGFKCEFNTMISFLFLFELLTFACVLVNLFYYLFLFLIRIKYFFFFLFLQKNK